MKVIVPSMAQVDSNGAAAHGAAAAGAAHGSVCKLGGMTASSESFAGTNMWSHHMLPWDRVT